MPAGRPAKPTTIKTLQGNPGKRKLPQNEPRYESGIPTCPAYLNADGKRWFGRVGKILDGAKVLTKADGDLLEQLALSYQTIRQAERQMKKHGILIDGTEGGLKKNPAATVLAEQQRILLSGLAQLGLTPATRGKVQALAEEEDAGPLGRIFSLNNERRNRRTTGD